MGAFVVNPGGMTHSVPDEWTPALLAEGFRLATEAEIAAWYAMQGLERPASEATDATSDDGGADQPGTRPDRRSRRE
jgi:hypothetical protein